MKKILINVLILGATLLHAEPVIILEFPGLLGNSLFVYCMAKIIAENMGREIYSEPIWGFPDTYSCISHTPSSQYPTEIVKDAPYHNYDIDINPIVNNKSLRNIKLQGHFQRYTALKPYTAQIRNNWLKIEPNLLLPKNKHDIVVHIRAQYPNIYYLPFEYYRKALELATYERVYICIDDPEHPFLENFRSYNPIIVSTRNLMQTMERASSWSEISKLNMDDFLFIHSFDKIICSFSTYSWWAAFLSDASEIYAPNPINEAFQYLKVDEPRYHYIDVSMGL